MYTGTVRRTWCIHFPLPLLPPARKACVRRSSPTSSHATQEVRLHELSVLLYRSAEQKHDDAKDEEERESMTRATREHHLQVIPDLFRGGVGGYGEGWAGTEGVGGGINAVVHDELCLSSGWASNYL